MRGFYSLSSLRFRLKTAKIYWQYPPKKLILTGLWFNPRITQAKAVKRNQLFRFRPLLIRKRRGLRILRWWRGLRRLIFFLYCNSLWSKDSLKNHFLHLEAAVSRFHSPLMSIRYALQGPAKSSRFPCEGRATKHVGKWHRPRPHWDIGLPFLRWLRQLWRGFLLCRK